MTKKDIQGILIGIGIILGILAIPFVLSLITGYPVNYDIRIRK